MYCKNERPNSVFGKKKKSCVLFRGPDQVGLFFLSSLKENYKYSLNIAWKHCKFIHRRKKHMKRVAMIKKAVYIKVWCSYAMTDNFACTFLEKIKKIFTVAQSGMILCVWKAFIPNNALIRVNLWTVSISVTLVSIERTCNCAPSRKYNFFSLLSGFICLVLLLSSSIFVSLRLCLSV